MDTLNLDAEVVLSSIPVASSEDTAYASVRATALGEPEMYYPPLHCMKQLVQMRHIFPGLLQFILDKVIGID